MWLRQAAVSFKQGYRCFLIDLRGHGLSEEPGEMTDIEVHLSDIQETLKELKLNYPVIFVGHSLGSIIALMLAERRPEIVHSVLAVGMPGKILKPVAGAFRWFLKGPFQSLKRKRRHQRFAWRERTLIKTDLHTLEQIQEHIGKLNFMERPFNVKCPVHFSVGRFDLTHIRMGRTQLYGSTSTPIQ
jgi:pimeloyl-ACP methyl ester carboxylesterase